MIHDDRKGFVDKHPNLMSWQLVWMPRSYIFNAPHCKILYIIYSISWLKIDTDECQSIPASPNIAYMSVQTFIENVRNSGRQPRFVFSHSGGGGWRGWRGRAAVSVFVALEIAAPVLGGEAEPLQHGGRGPGLVQQHHLHCSAELITAMFRAAHWSVCCCCSDPPLVV